MCRNAIFTLVCEPSLYAGVTTKGRWVSKKLNLVDLSPRPDVSSSADQVNAHDDCKVDIGCCQAGPLQLPRAQSPAVSDQSSCFEREPSLAHPPATRSRYQPLLCIIVADSRGLMRV